LRDYFVHVGGDAMSRKILISTGFGAGWATWHYGPEEERQFMLEYPPFIEALEKDLPLSTGYDEEGSNEGWL
jgi:hypothetical protein